MFFCHFNYGELAMIIYSTNKIAVVKCKRVHPDDFPDLPDITWGITFSFGCVCWNTGHVEQLFTVFFMFGFMLVQQMDSLASLVFSIPMWWLWSWSRTYFHCYSLLLVGCLWMSSMSIYSVPLQWPASYMYSFSLCRYSLFCIPPCMSFIDIHIGVSVVVLIESMLNFMPIISAFLLSLQLYLDSQSTMK